MNNETFIKEASRPDPGGVVVIPEKSGWVSVEDRLPDLDQKVIYYKKSTGVIGICLFSHRKTVWTEEVTHWMPRPEPPQI